MEQKITYPWKGAFESREEVDAYFAGDKIQCLLCGKWFKQISSSHLLRVHNTTFEEYRKRYRLPWGRGLTGRTTHIKISRNAKQHWPGNNIREYLDFSQRKTARPRQDFLAFQKWTKKDCEAILTRMQEQQRSLHDVCSDPDLPSHTSWKKFAALHPELEEQVKDIYASWPYHVQTRVRRELSPQFRIDCQRLHKQGLSYRKIAKTLGVDTDTVFRTFKKIRAQKEKQHD